MTTLLHAGILAHSVPGAARCFSRFCESGMAALGQHEHPQVTLDCIPMGRSMAAWERNDLDAVRDILTVSAERLARAGCDFFVCPDNTAHLALERPGPDLPLPGLHIAEVVAAEADRRGSSRVGILGTRWTMEAALYPRELARYGIGTEIPGDADRATIQRLTFAELTQGIFTETTRSTMRDVIARLGEQGCDTVALVCTEFPLLIGPENSPLPTLESTTLVADAAAAIALGGQSVPHWRGGPREPL